MLVGIVLRESESAPPANQRTSWPSYGQVEVVDGEFQTFSSPSDIVVVVPSRGVPKVRVLSPLTRWKGSACGTTTCLFGEHRCSVTDHPAAKHGRYAVVPRAFRGSFCFAAEVQRAWQPP